MKKVLIIAVASLMAFAAMAKFRPTLYEKVLRRAADEVIPYDGLPSPSKLATDKDVRRTSGRFLSAARLNQLPVLPQIQSEQPGDDAAYVTTDDFVPVDEETFRYLERLHVSATR